MLKRSASKMFKVGKKLCFPNAPSTYIPRTVESILRFRESQGRFKPKPPKDAYVWSFQNAHSNVDGLMYANIEEKRIYLDQGDPFDVISLLKTKGAHTDHSDTNDAYLVRNNGDIVQVDSLRGKNIFVCCVYVPCFWLFLESNGLRALFTLFAQLNNANSPTQTEMVIVPKMRPNWVANEHAFNHFFSGFPSSWLTVPFSHALRRHHICNSLGLSNFPRALLVDPTQKIVFHDYLYSFGFYDFSFSHPDYSDLWWKKYTQLDSILNLDSRHVFNTIRNDSNIKFVSVSQLKQKVVGLYLCFDGSFIRTLDSIYQQCKARNQEFEVVLVYLPYKEGVNPSLFQEAINHVFHILNISNWWVSPFDDFVSRRLWEVVRFSKEDELVILDPHTNIVDPFAKYVAKCFGVDLYPFTREVLVRRELEAMRAVTLESLLVYGSRNHVLCIDDDNNVKQVPIAQLRGKIVFLYIEDLNMLPVDEKLVDWYNWIKTTRAADDFEVVFFSRTPFDNPKSLLVIMPWLVCPFDLQHTMLVTRKTLKMCYRGNFVAFGKDGHIIELNAEKHLNKYGLEDFPSDDGLCKDIIFHLHDSYEIDMTGVVGPQA